MKKRLNEDWLSVVLALALIALALLGWIAPTWMKF
jgi:hypothetical protein